MAKKILITVIVLSTFQDRFDHKTQYPVGTELQVEKERADDLVNRGLAKVKEVTPPKEPKELKKPKTTGKAKVTEPIEKAGSENPEKKQEDEPGTEE